MFFRVRYLLILAGLLKIQLAHAGVCNEVDFGTYTNSNYDSEFYQASVTAKFAGKQTVRFEIVIPCGSKMTPATLAFSCPESGSRYTELTAISKGSSQCSLGQQPTISIIGNDLEIRTGIRVPGFEGTYIFHRQ